MKLDLEFDNLLEKEDVSVIPTGFTFLDDDLLKIGGFPRGKVVEIYGQPDTCKSLLCYYALRSAQEKYKDLRIGIIDTEFRCDAKWLQQQGIDLSRCDIKQVVSAEEAFNYVITMLESGLYSIVVLDSIGNVEAEGNMVGTRFERDKKTGGMKSDRVGELAQVVTKSTKRIVSAASKSNTCFVAVNQLRDSIGSFVMTNIESTPGGRCWKYNRTVALRLQTVGYVKTGEILEGVKIKVTLSRSKISTPQRSTDENTHLTFFLNGGQDKARLYSIFEKAVMSGALEKKGMWVYWNARELKFKGKENALKHFQDNPEDLELLAKNVEDEPQLHEEPLE